MSYSIKDDLQVLGLAFLGQYTTAQRNALNLTASEAGGLAFDSTSNELYLWTGTAWKLYITEANLALGTVNGSSIQILIDKGTDVTISEATQASAGLLTAADKTNLDALKNLDGVAPGATNLGTFTGSIVPDNTTIKGAIQSIETDLGAFKSLKGVASGLAELDANGHVPIGQLPSLAITDVSVVADIAARNALTVQEGDVAKVIDSDGNGNPQTYIYDGTVWVDIQETSDVISVNGKTGTVTLNSSEIPYNNAAAAAGSPTENDTNLQEAVDNLNDAVTSISGNNNTVAITFEQSDWSGPVSGKYVLSITQGDHGLTAGDLQIVNVQELVSPNVYENVGLESQINISTGTITLRVRQNPDARFEGRLIITQDH